MAKKHDEISGRFAAKIVMKPVEWIKPYARNARTHSREQIQQIAASMREFGFVNPMLVKADGTIIAGHGRFEAATTQLDYKEVPVIILDHLSDKQAQLLVIADNKLALNAGWNDDLLTAELLDLEAAGMALELTGFSDDELADLFEQSEEENEGEGEGEQESSDSQQISFTVLKKDARKVRAAIQAALDNGAADEDDGAALVAICKAYMESIKENKKAEKAAAKIK